MSRSLVVNDDIEHSSEWGVCADCGVTTWMMHKTESSNPSSTQAYNSYPGKSHPHVRKIRSQLRLSRKLRQARTPNDVATMTENHCRSHQSSDTYQQPTAHTAHSGQEQRLCSSCADGERPVIVSANCLTKRPSAWFRRPTKQCANLWVKLKQRESVCAGKAGHMRSSAYHTTRSLYQSVVPNIHVRSVVRNPDIAISRFSRTGKYLVSFDRHKKHVTLHHFRWPQDPQFPLHGTTTPHTGTEENYKSFSDFFKQRSDIALPGQGSGGARPTKEKLCTDIALFTPDDAYLVLMSTIAFTDDEINHHADHRPAHHPQRLLSDGRVRFWPVNSNVMLRPASHYNIHVVCTRSARVVSSYHVPRDNIVLTDYGCGPHLSGHVLTVVSLCHQTVRLFSINERTGELCEDRNIGVYCNESDEMAMNAMEYTRDRSHEEPSLYRSVQSVRNLVPRNNPLSTVPTQPVQPNAHTTQVARAQVSIDPLTVDVQTNLPSHTHTRTHTHAHTRVRPDTHTHAHTRVRPDTHTHAHTRVRPDTHTHAHQQTIARRRVDAMRRVSAIIEPRNLHSRAIVPVGRPPRPYARTGLQIALFGADTPRLERTAAMVPDNFNRLIRIPRETGTDEIGSNLITRPSVVNNLQIQTTAGVNRRTMEERRPRTQRNIDVNTTAQEIPQNATTRHMAFAPTRRILSDWDSRHSTQHVRDTQNISEHTPRTQPPPSRIYGSLKQRILSFLYRLALARDTGRAQPSETTLDILKRHSNDQQHGTTAHTSTENISSRDYNDTRLSHTQHSNNGPDAAKMRAQERRGVERGSGNRASVQLFLRNMESYENLAILKAQLMDENHLLLRMGDASLVQTSPGTKHTQHPLLLVVYNIPQSKVLGVYQNDSVALVNALTSAGYLLYDDAIPHTSNSMGARDAMIKTYNGIKVASSGGHTLAQRHLVSLYPVTAQAHALSPYYDPDLYTYDASVVSPMQRTMWSLVSCTRFCSKLDGTVKFELHNPMAETSVVGPQRKQQVTTLIHPSLPFAITFSSQSTTYTLHYRGASET